MIASRIVFLFSQHVWFPNQIGWPVATDKHAAVKRKPYRAGDLVVVPAVNVAVLSWVSRWGAEEKGVCGVRLASLWRVYLPMQPKEPKKYFFGLENQHLWICGPALLCGIFFWVNSLKAYDLPYFDDDSCIEWSSHFCIELIKVIPHRLEI